MLREWYMHPNGQLPAYEWTFEEVNPLVHAWATWRVYDTERRMTGVADRAFLERVFHKLLLNFTWWVNRRDPDGLNVFQGGFLGLDNIGVIDRNADLPGGGQLEQSDGDGDAFLVECPTGSGTMLTLNQIVDELSDCLARLFLRYSSPPSAAPLLFDEFFHGDTGQGPGARHQTGWTGLIASLLAQRPSSTLNSKLHQGH
jgi:hypothetical protein